MTLNVIGTGFGRTGTDSMREALDILGVGPTHHMNQVIDNDEQIALWRALAAGETPDWPRLFKGYRSCVDWPSAAYWRELIALYPDAKVILTWRSAESWWNSFSQTILPMIDAPIYRGTLGYELIANQVFGGRPGDRDHAIAAYKANVAAVRAEVPAGRLLVYETGAGWAPLCAHLNLPVPDRPYPNRNSTAEFRESFGSEAGQDG